MRPKHIRRSLIDKPVVVLRPGGDEHDDHNPDDSRGRYSESAPTPSMGGVRTRCANRVRDREQVRIVAQQVDDFARKVNLARLPMSMSFLAHCSGSPSWCAEGGQIRVLLISRETFALERIADVGDRTLEPHLASRFGGPEATRDLRERNIVEEAQQDDFSLTRRK